MTDTKKLSIITSGLSLLIIKLAALLALTLLFFRQDLSIVFSDALRSETSSHILAIPFILAYLVYRKRKVLKAVASTQNVKHDRLDLLPPIIGTLLLLIGIALYWHGSYTFTPLEYHIAALPIFVAGATLVFFNVQTLRQSIFLIAFLLFLVPPPSQLLANIGTTLSILSSEVSNAVVSLLGVPSMIILEYGNPAILITRPDGTQIPFIVDMACSGIYSLIGFMIFAAFAAYIIRDKPWKKIMLFVIGFPLVYFLNVLRIVIILLIGYHQGEQIALQMFHLLGGWTLIFLGTILLLTIADKILKTQLFTKTGIECPHPKLANSAFCLSCGRIHDQLGVKLTKRDIAKIGAVASIVFVVISFQAPVFALTESPPIVAINTPAGQQFSTDILPEIAGYTLAFYYRDTQFEETANQDMSLIYGYMAENASNDPVWVSIEIASSLTSLHTWEKCLITWPITHGRQPTVTQIDLRDVRVLDNPPIFARHFVFQYKATNLTQAVLYWYETTKFIVDSTVQQKHSKISLIVYPSESTDLVTLQGELETIATEVAEYWQPIKVWSQVTLTLSQNGDKLIATTTVTVVALVLIMGLDYIRKKRRNFQTYNKLSKADKRLVDTIQEIEKTSGLPTLNNVIDMYKIGKKTIDERKIAEKLSNMEKIGIIRGQIFNRHDEPVQTWRTKIAFR